MDPTASIPELVPGGTRTVFSADVSNGLIRAANRITNLQVVDPLELVALPDGGMLLRLKRDPDLPGAGNGNSSAGGFPNTAQNFTASCPLGTTGPTNSITVAAGTIVSLVSQADADALALELATDRATNGLACTFTGTYGFDGPFVGGNVQRIKIRPDGIICAAGFFNHYGGIERNGYALLNPDLSLNPAYAYPFQASGGGCKDVAPTSVNDVYIIGPIDSLDARSSKGIAKVAANGDIDVSFATAAGFPAPGGGAQGSPTCITVDGLDRILFGGASINTATYRGTSVSGLVRLNTNGTIHTSFPFTDNTGTLAPGLPIISKILIDAFSNLCCLGDFTNMEYSGTLLNTVGPPVSGRKFFVVISAAGALQAFSEVGTGFDSQPADVAFSGSNFIFVGGFTHYNGTARAGILILDSTGALQAFNPAITAAGGGPNYYCVAVDGLGRYLIGGDFTTINGSARTGIFRLTAAGVLDTSFITPTITDGTGMKVSCLAIQSNGNIVIGGRFDHVAGKAVGDIATLSPTGAYLYPAAH